MKIGCDIMKISKFNEPKESFLRKYFNESEINYISLKNVKHQPQTLAGLFCAKEAFLKAVGVGMGNGITLLDIEISHDENGCPNLKYKGNNPDIAKLNFDVSVSHDEDVAMAVVLVW